MDSNYEMSSVSNKLSKGRRVILPFMFSAFLTLGACLPEPLEVTGIPRVEPEIVVSSQIIPDQSLIVFVTRTFGALEASDDSDPGSVFDQIAVNDALVTIHYDNETDTLQFIDKGTYGGINIGFVVGQTYTLRIESETLGIVTAATQAKPQVKFDEVAASLYFDGFDDTLAQVSYSLIDPPEKNWYMLNVLEVDSADIINNLLNPRDFTRLLSDDDFSGETYNEVFRVFPREFDKGDTIAIYLSNISREYYDYMEMRLDNRFGFFEFVSEPVNYPSNVEGGRGFFNLYIPDIQFIVLN